MFHTGQNPSTVLAAGCRGRDEAGRESAHEYLLTSHWTFDATPAEVVAAMSALETPALWWPAGFLRVDMLRPGGGDGQGMVVRFLSKGWLPHTFQFVLHMKEVRVPTCFQAEVRGDFVGCMSCHLVVRDGRTVAETEWRVSVAKPFVRRFSRLFRRIFVMNHHWVMRRGEEGLRMEIERRRLGRPVGSVIYPGATFPHNVPWFTRRIAWRPWTASWERAGERR